MYEFLSSNLSTEDKFCIRQVFKKWKYNDKVQQLFSGFKRDYDSVMGEVLYNIVI